MGLAPVPGVGRRQQAERTGIRISVGGNTWVLHTSDLGPQDDLISRKETGLPVTPFFSEDRFGMDSLLIMFWVCRRKNGEPNLRFQQVLDEYPSYESIDQAGFKIEAIENVNELEEADAGDPLPFAEG